MKNQYSFLLWLNKNKINHSGKAPVYARITINGKRAELSSGVYVEPERWNQNKGLVRGTNEESRMLNDALDRMARSLRQKFNELEASSDVVSAFGLKNVFLGRAKRDYTLLEAFKKTGKRCGRTGGAGLLPDYLPAVPDYFHLFERIY